MIEVCTFWLLIVCLDAVAIASIALAPRIVAGHARMYRQHYRDAEARARLDQMQKFNLLSRYVIGRMSDYANIGPDNPWAFPKMIAFVRILGLLLTLWITGAAALAFWSLLH